MRNDQLEMFNYFTRQGNLHYLMECVGTNDMEWIKAVVEYVSWQCESTAYILEAIKMFMDWYPVFQEFKMEYGQIWHYQPDTEHL